MNADPYQAPAAVASAVQPVQFVAALAMLAALQGVAVVIALGVASVLGGLGEPLALLGIAAGATVWHLGVRQRLGDARGLTLLCLLAHSVLVVLLTIPVVARPFVEGTVNLLEIGVALAFGGLATVAGVVGAQLASPVAPV